MRVGYFHGNYGLVGNVDEGLGPRPRSGRGQAFRGDDGLVAGITGVRVATHVYGNGFFSWQWRGLRGGREGLIGKAKFEGGCPI